MIKKLKSNKIIILLLLVICIIFILNPSVYIKSCSNAISVWAINVLPALFPFFVLTRLIVSLSEIKANKLDKLFTKAYHTPAGSSFIFFLSILSGYPMGAKLINLRYNQKQISKSDAIKMLSFCSVSGPMFMLGTVGINIFNSYKCGIIILICNIIACLINGLLYRGKFVNEKRAVYQHKKNENILSESVYDSMISILIVGAYIVLSFLLIDILTNIKFIDFFANLFCKVFNISNPNYIKACISGIIEITRGAVDLSKIGVNKITITLASGLIGFGGLSVFLQSTAFINNIGISKKTIFLQKLTQGLICALVAIIITQFI